MRTKLIAGNWKMNKTTAEAMAFAEEFLNGYNPADNEVAICAPFMQLASLKKAFEGSGVKLGAQNMHFADAGAYTGEISPLMLAEVGVDYVIIGHSERRQYFAETDEVVNSKLKAVLSHGFDPIVCVGESLEQRDAGEEFSVVEAQVRGSVRDLSPEEAAGLVVAYEPVWAIGTGRTASPEQAQEMCCFIRKTLESMYGGEAAASARVLYGGSVKPVGAAEILTKPDIDGALVGGASLNPPDFQGIISY